MTASIPADAERGASSASGFRLIIAATAISGVTGLLITWLVPRYVGFAAYPPFAVFWAFLFLVVSALSGVQQEVTRATTTTARRDADARGVVTLAIALSGGVATLVLGTSPMWVHAAFPEAGWRLVWPLVVGAASYVVAAVFYGSLYGKRQWRTLFWLMVVEGLGRLGLVGLALALDQDIVVLAWAVALPIPLAIVAVSGPLRGVLRDGIGLDVGVKTLAWNLSRTVVAAASMGVLVSGLPFVIGMVSRDEPAASVGLMISATTLTRSPLIVVAMALQSYVIVLFTSNPERFRAIFLKLVAVLMVAAVVLATLAYLVGPSVFVLLFPDEERPRDWVLAVLVASALLVGLLFVTASAALARSKHTAFVTGWVVAALLTVAILVTPLDFTTRVLLAVVVAPCGGLAIHVFALFGRSPGGAVQMLGRRPSPS